MNRGNRHREGQRIVVAVRPIAAALLSIAWGSGFAAGTLPTGGVVTAGSGSITQSGAHMTINQATNKLAIDWQSFSIGAGNSVTFNQPSASAVALNRVLGSDVSVIQGALRANGQVFLINPNGVLFTPTAQVNVGGIIASTQGLSNADFMAGNYRFSGGSSNAVINQGNIVAAGENGTGGTVALIAARVVNDGTISAPAGNVLLGAGSEVTLDLGGPVKIRVDKGAVDALVDNGGAIRADGGTVFLTARAAGELLATVINNDGIIEAQTLATGEKGRIVLLGDKENGRVTVGGTLDASAPDGGDGGFVETSGAKVEFKEGLRVTTLAARGRTGDWLIDPATYTVATSGGDETGSALATRLGGSNITLQADNTVTIADAVSWSANKLTLSSGGNIAVSANLTATGTASLAFEYGQATANGSGSSYTVANGVKIYVPDADKFTWKKGSGGTVSNLVFDNGKLRFGDGTAAALTASGQFKQPFYYNTGSSSSGCNTNTWCKLTFSSYPLDIAVGAGGAGTSSWNYNGQVLSTNTSNSDTYSPALSGKSLEISGYREGVGTIVATGTLGFTAGEQVKVENAYTLDAGAQFVRTVTTLTNSGAGSAGNVRLWVGTRDDYVAGNDSNYKYKGNLTANGFESITAQDQQAKAIKISTSNTSDGTGILFYSTASGADTVSDECCEFNNVTNKDPRLSSIVTPREDGSYALFMRQPDLAAGQSSSMTWYYAAGAVSELASIATSVAQSAGVATPAPAPAPTITTRPPLTAAVTTTQAAASQPLRRMLDTGATPGRNSLVAMPNPLVQNVPRDVSVTGGLAFVPFVAASAPGGNPAPGGGTSATAPNDGNGTTAAAPVVAAPTAGSLDPFGFMRVFVVGGGINVPALASNP